MHCASARAHASQRHRHSRLCSVWSLDRLHFGRCRQLHIMMFRVKRPRRQPSHDGPTLARNNELITCLLCRKRDISLFAINFLSLFALLFFSASRFRLRARVHRRNSAKNGSRGDEDITKRLLCARPCVCVMNEVPGPASHARSNDERCAKHNFSIKIEANGFRKENLPLADRRRAAVARLSAQ